MTAHLSPSYLTQLLCTLCTPLINQFTSINFKAENKEPLWFSSWFTKKTRRLSTSVQAYCRLTGKGIKFCCHLSFMPRNDNLSYLCLHVLPQTNNSGLKQKADIEQYRNKLRQKARRKGYGEFSLSETGSHGYSHRDTRHSRHDNGVKEPMTAEEKRASFAGCHKRYEAIYSFYKLQFKSSRTSEAFYYRQYQVIMSPFLTELNPYFIS